MRTSRLWWTPSRSGLWPLDNEPRAILVLRRQRCDEQLQAECEGVRFVLICPAEGHEMLTCDSGSEKSFLGLVPSYRAV